MKPALLAILALLFAAPAYAQPAEDPYRYSFDQEHTTILFYVNHLGFSDMVGRVQDYSGEFFFNRDKPEESKVDVTLKPISISTSSRALDAKLQGENFFNTDKFPDITFKSTSVKVTGENMADVTGDLTIRGLTRSAVLKVKLNKMDNNPFSGSFVAGFSAETNIKRSDYGMTIYLPQVGDEVRIVIQTEGVNAARSKAINKL